MTLVIVVSTPEGIIMASDSRAMNISNLDGKEEKKYDDTVRKIYICPNDCGIAASGQSLFGGKFLPEHILNFIKERVNEKSKVSEIPDMIKDYFLKFLSSISYLNFFIAGYEKQDGKLKRLIFSVRIKDNTIISKLESNGLDGYIYDGATKEGIEKTKLKINLDFSLHSAIEFCTASINETMEISESVGGQIHILLIKPEGINGIRKNN